MRAAHAPKNKAYRPPDGKAPTRLRIHIATPTLAPITADSSTCALT